MHGERLVELHRMENQFEPSPLIVSEPESRELLDE